MRTLGVDLASQPAKTAACVVAWQAGRATAETPRLGLADGDLLTMAAGCEAVGIDAPFGWPQPFVDFLAEEGAPPWDAARRDALCFRRTDRRVWAALGRPPLSVSSDRIALPAMRCAGLLRALGVADRSGGGRVVEVYPAVALKRWGLLAKGYKAPRRAPRRLGEAAADAPLPLLFGALLAACPWLEIGEVAAALCRRDDDAFDALVAALIARAAALGLTERPAPEEEDLARVEGWIAVPVAGSLGRLATGTGEPTQNP